MCVGLMWSHVGLMWDSCGTHVGSCGTHVSPQAKKIAIPNHFQTLFLALAGPQIAPWWLAGRLTHTLPNSFEASTRPVLWSSKDLKLPSARCRIDRPAKFRIFEYPVADTEQTRNLASQLRVLCWLQAHFETWVRIALRMPIDSATVRAGAQAIFGSKVLAKSL